MNIKICILTTSEAGKGSFETKQIDRLPDKRKETGKTERIGLND